MSQPTFQAQYYTCPLCFVFSQQNWMRALDSSHFPYDALWWSTCLRCQKRTIWYEKQMVAPVTTTAPQANEDMPEEIMAIFNEARDISERSPRGAAALLRLCIQKLCVHLGEPGKDLTKDIGALVAQGLPVTVQQALDAVRVVGNNQLHPKNEWIDLRTEPQAVAYLFTLVNQIVDTMISTKRRTDEFYASLPKGALDAVERRDS